MATRVQDLLRSQLKDHPFPLDPSFLQFYNDDISQIISQYIQALLLSFEIPSLIFKHNGSYKMGPLIHMVSSTSCKANLPQFSTHNVPLPSYYDSSNNHEDPSSFYYPTPSSGYNTASYYHDPSMNYDVLPPPYETPLQSYEIPPTSGEDFSSSYQASFPLPYHYNHLQAHEAPLSSHEVSPPNYEQNLKPYETLSSNYIDSTIHNGLYSNHPLSSDYENSHPPFFYETEKRFQHDDSTSSVLNG